MGAAAMKARGRAGFTLVELLIAMVIGGMIAAAAYEAMASASDAWARLRVRRDPVLAGYTARGMLDGWFRAATRLDTGAPFIGLDQDGADAPQDVVAFDVRDGGEFFPGPHRLRLWVDRDPRTDATGLVVAISPAGPDPSPEQLVVLAPAAFGLDLRYRTRVDGRARWLNSWSEERQVPEAVELRVIAPPLVAGGRQPAELPRLLQLPVLVTLDTVPTAKAKSQANGDEQSQSPRPTRLRAGCSLVDSRAGRCPGG